MPNTPSAQSPGPPSSPGFIVYALPRSRTFWLSRVLSYRGWACGHDQARYVRNLDDVRRWLSLPFTGTVETAAAPFWRLVHEFRPELRTLVVRRPVEDVVRSLVGTGVEFDVGRLRHDLRRLDFKLDQIERRVPGVLSVSFDALSDEATFARAFEHCLPFRHDPQWWAAAAPANLQINVGAMTRYYLAHADVLAKVAQSAGQHMRAKLMARPVCVEGFIFQPEALDTVLRDGQHLFAEHAVRIGEDPGEAYRAKNFELMRVLEQMNVLHVVSARSNGRLFGYLVSIVSPSLDQRGKVEALHSSFCVSQAAPGLGLKLQRASVEFLRGLGVDELALRAGTKGAGPRLAALYRRMGAVEAGQTFLLDLKGAA